jgi:hypothetical protein
LATSSQTSCGGRPISTDSSTRTGGDSTQAAGRTFTDGTEDLFGLLDTGIEWIPINAALEGRSYQREAGIRIWIDEMKREWESFETRIVN